MLPREFPRSISEKDYKQDEAREDRSARYEGHWLISIVSKEAGQTVEANHPLGWFSLTLIQNSAIYCATGNARQATRALTGTSPGLAIWERNTPSFVEQ